MMLAIILIAFLMLCFTYRHWAGAARSLSLDARLLRLSQHDSWSVRTALTHLLVLGTTGSGKSSATLKHVIIAMLTAGFGALFCVAKAEDAETIKSYCKATGRMGSLLDWTGINFGFNFLAYELSRTGNINNVIDCLMAVIEMIRTSGASPGRASDQFWTDSILVMLRHTIPVVFAATGTVRIDDVLAFIRSGPSSPEQLENPQWRQTSAFCRMFVLAADRLRKGPIPGFDDAVAERAAAYWRDDFARLDPKTASNIRISVTTALSRFEQGWLKEAFCGETSIAPALLFSAGIILMNFPVQTHGEDAAIGQKLFKFMVQREALARNGLPKIYQQRPIAIIADEAQNFLHNDAEFLAQCRSSLVAVVFATQSLPTLYAKIGGDHPHDRAQHLVSNFGTVVLHSSACPETNEWFARKIGRSLQARTNYSMNEGSNRSFGMNMGEGTNCGRSSQSGGSSSSGQGGSSSGSSWGSGSSSGSSDQWGRNQGAGTSQGQSWGQSMVMDHWIEPGDFGRILKTGGPANRNRVSAIWYQSGRIFGGSGMNALLVEFRQ